MDRIVRRGVFLLLLARRSVHPGTDMRTRQEGASGGRSLVAIGAARAGWNDCAALTAARIIRTAAGGAVSAKDVAADAQLLVKRWALPGKAYEFNVAKQYALDYFLQLGIELEAKPSDITNEKKLAEGSYAVFFQGGSLGGHVLFGRFARAEGLKLIDDQTGKTFAGYMAAQSGLSMQWAGAFHVLSVKKH
jgi:hypothetical protein